MVKKTSSCWIVAVIWIVYTQDKAPYQAEPTSVKGGIGPLVRDRALVLGVLIANTPQIKMLFASYFD